MRAYVISEDRRLRRSVGLEMAVSDIEVWPFGTSAEFLRVAGRLSPAVIVLDLDTASHCSLDVMAGFRSEGIYWPVLVASRSEELALAVGAMKLGAVDFLRKPIPGGALHEAVALASAALDSFLSARQLSDAAKERLATLSTRQLQILIALLSGGVNKVVAHRLGISVRTVEMHRAQLLIKLDVRSLAEAAVLAVHGGIELQFRNRKTAFSGLAHLSAAATGRERAPRPSVAGQAMLQPDRPRRTDARLPLPHPPRRVAGEGPMR